MRALIRISEMVVATSVIVALGLCFPWIWWVSLAGVTAAALEFLGFVLLRAWVRRKPSRAGRQSTKVFSNFLVDFPRAGIYNCIHRWEVIHGRNAMKTQVIQIRSSRVGKVTHLLGAVALLGYVVTRVWLFRHVCTWDQVATDLMSWASLVSLGLWRM